MQGLFLLKRYLEQNLLFQKNDSSGSILKRKTLFIHTFGTSYKITLVELKDQPGSSTFQRLYWGALKKVSSVFGGFVCLALLFLEKFLRTGFHFNSICIWIFGNTGLEWGKWKAGLLVWWWSKKVFILLVSVTKLPMDVQCLQCWLKEMPSYNTHYNTHYIFLFLFI